MAALVNVAEAAAAAKRVAEAYAAARASGQSEEEAALSTHAVKPDPAGPRPPFSFVIPKNKLPGQPNNQLAIIPTGGFGSGKPGEVPPFLAGESKPPKPRVNKWGPDPLHNHIVRKGRSLALQVCPWFFLPLASFPFPPCNVSGAVACPPFQAPGPGSRLGAPSL